MKDTPERGMVVTIFLDPDNHTGSTIEQLCKLEEGDYGPFYQPDER